MTSNRHPVLFGSDFDPNPDINSIRRKIVRYIESEGRRGRSPYDIFEENLYHDQKEKLVFKIAGKYPCPGWLSAIPVFDQEIYPETFREFIDEGGCLQYAMGFGQYMTSYLEAGEIPITIGVDHCLTGGIVDALAKKYSDLLVLVFDAHLDGISPYVRNGLVGFMREQSSNTSSLLYEYHEGTFTGNYDTGSFLNYLLKGETLPGRDLMITGIQDHPSPQLWKLKDQRVVEYLKEYEWLKTQEVAIQSLETVDQVNLKSTLPELKGKLAGRNVYLSIDLDVFTGKIGQATRYSTDKGLTIAKTFKLLEWLALSQSNLVGVDIMELDVNSLAVVGITEREVYRCLKNIINGIFQELES